MSSQFTLSIPVIWKTSFTYSPGTAGYGSWLRIVISGLHASSADAKLTDSTSNKSITTFLI